MSKSDWSLTRWLEHRLFYFLLGRNVKQNKWRIEMNNGCLYLLPRHEYDVVIKSSTLMRRSNNPTNLNPKKEEEK